MKGFIEFIRERGVVGFAVAFILGGAITKLVASLVTDIVNPILGVVLSKTRSLETMYFRFGQNKILWGHFVSSCLDFLILALVVYFVVKGLGLEKVDKKK
ncbi:MAG: Large-conductance mechanosensitive channel-like protein [Candidatus Roizmanbacteria bacterium GW2011_GWA2_35_19]|uniref:Large-conductance mechanosensitive channel-like protein n=2 Tax=Candidatus Roizmaniibacteriota TaxID=1752723 RepID=A0A0G0CA30_9BACT|nr:MAG: Large-conductance mechanosensitive channel-like protein [Candidatus Roizmanbacteria bacterium GW2011_GWC2_35_12]KKP72986.1 MAG: Large-conductance mechanosensitive channel-like protein [Candidatus Roizmanbacteria bacterium GW2011_GWA2_35_19]